MTWLITGGAGYIGAHIVDIFLNKGESVLVIDNLRGGKLTRIKDNSIFKQCDITNFAELEKIFAQNDIEGVLHLAALKSVSESQKNPNEYFQVNVVGTRNLLELSHKYGVKLFIQSSSAAVYGNSPLGIVHEEANLQPISIYGETKLQAENILDKYIKSGLVNGVSLRYFNVVGAKNYEFRDTSAANLFPILRNRIRDNEQPEVFGNQFLTPDGTCIRDYVHVLDVAQAHFDAARILRSKKIAPHLNLGTGIGYSVLEVINAMYRHYNLDAIPIIKPARLGDPAKLIADVSLSKREIGFDVSLGLAEMISSTY